ncbi:DUF2854 domain-containing protein [Nodosilinea sp. LEGE 07298]|uniref:DUF2854 domain-containing protein n=1 Tax=Nodosilinea sp. LEGE 07298 TaxID=2777970 RepID=UPI001881DBD6|nr:DUF2854 domain-containing protein [Nodosilinea sp. LEGE 07298]MBE9111892.1 DUF2854 domain-containing protein [Nodosilinea sp. LEGE 07298]
MLGRIKLGQFNLSLVLLAVGGVLTIVGFVAYFQDNSTLNLVGFFYGIPVLLGGLALRAAELEPAPYTRPTSPEVLKLREEQATPTQNQVRQDVTRYRYGQEAHLDVALQKLGLSPSGQECPELSGLHEAEVDGNYALVLEFDSSTLPFSTWVEKKAKIESFFGPSVRAELSQPTEDQVNLALITSLEPAIPAPVEA